jgi:hypothetical protein
MSGLRPGLIHPSCWHDVCHGQVLTAATCERMTEVGGRLDAGPAESGGFRLYAEVPA